MVSHTLKLVIFDIGENFYCRGSNHCANHQCDNRFTTTTTYILPMQCLSVLLHCCKHSAVVVPLWTHHSG
jgi:hypothetical protein